MQNKKLDLNKEYAVWLNRKYNLLKLELFVTGSTERSELHTESLIFESCHV